MQTHWTVVPHWVNQLVGTSNSEGRDLSISTNRHWALLTGVIENADALDDKDLQQATADLYTGLLDRLGQTPAPHPVRAWNLVPTIHRTERPGQDRYMAFNAGRHAAYRNWFGEDARMAKTMPTASAVGCPGRDLIVHLLGHHQPGQAIENPRQVPAFRYSKRFGDLPPSFVRATRLTQVDSASWVLVAGTASVVGEVSRHPGDLTAQLNETFRNLATVMLQAANDPRPINGHLSSHEREALRGYRTARVYTRRPEDLARISQAVTRTMPNCESIELVRADICRPELLVEIEGTGVLPHGRWTHD